MPATVDQFDIFRIIGTGAFGEVAAVRKNCGIIDNGRLYAMKVMDKRKMYRFAQRLDNEWKLLISLRSPFCTKMAYSFQTVQKVVFVMPLAGGGDLMTRMENGTLNEKDAFFYLCELVEAVGYLHGKQIVHRDIKLENILIASDGHLMLSDFGFAANSITTDKSVNECIGTRHTMAPEVLIRKPYGLASDWWAVGITYCDLRDELSVFEGSNNSSYSMNTIKKRPKLPKSFSPNERCFVLKLLAKDPSRRLGYNGIEEVKKQHIFKTVDWDDVVNKKLVPPFIPTVEDINDFIFFPETTREKPLPDFDTDDGSFLWELDVDYTDPELL